MQEHIPGRLLCNTDRQVLEVIGPVLHTQTVITDALVIKIQSY